MDDGETHPFNDSGCLLDDKELFDNGLEEENASLPEDEESIESIRAAVKDKIKKYKVLVGSVLFEHVLNNLASLLL